MKLAIMQPYFFPYIGYFQLIDSVDSFVIYDDVNFIKGGWINRNYILVRCVQQLITLQVLNASPNNLINEVRIGGNQKKILATIQQAYSKAPEFRRVYPLIESIIQYPEKNLSQFLAHALQLICDFLGVQVTWYTSSNLEKDNRLRGQAKVLAICDELDATHYINAPGGRALYDHSEFSGRGIDLSFIESDSTSYSQGCDQFVSNLSIIDVMMFNDRKGCSTLLDQYSILKV